MNLEAIKSVCEESRLNCAFFHDDVNGSVVEMTVVPASSGKRSWSKALRITESDTPENVAGALVDWRLSHARMIKSGRDLHSVVEGVVADHGKDEIVAILMDCDTSLSMLHA